MKKLFLIASFVFAAIIIVWAQAAIVCWAQGGFNSGAYFVNPTTLGNVPMCNQFVGGLCVYSPSGLVDNGTNLLYKGTPVTQVTTGVTSVIAGQGVTVSGATGDVTLTANIAKGSITYTTAATNSGTVTGATANSHCTFSATNAIAAGDIANDYISTKATNSITITHTGTTVTGGTVDVICTLN